VTLRALPARTVAAVQFSGWATEDSVNQHTEALNAWVAAQNWPVQGSVQLAFYNPPWTLPWWRRNEIWLPMNISQ
jgi:DNA gyrase inhibitor GyrI